MIETYLRQLADSPRRLLIVTMVSFAIGLVTLLPLVDEYDTLGTRSAELEMALDEARTSAANLGTFERRVATQVAELAAWEDRAISGERVHELHGRIVSLAREAGCQVRRINAGAVQSRTWRNDDHPLERAAGGRNKKDQTGYDLLTQPLSVTVSGSLPELTRLLAALHAEKSLSHTRTCLLRPAGVDRKEVVLELEFWLFDLARVKAVSA